MSETPISEEMLKRLQANKNGKLTFAQLRDVATEPLAPLMLLILPAVIMVGRMPISFRGLLYAFIIAMVVTLVPGTIRALRYSRKPIYHAHLYAEGALSGVLFWRKLSMVKVSGEPIVFEQKLAPMVKLKRNQAYLVYYLKDKDKAVLLSLAPVDHPQSQTWQPTEKNSKLLSG